MKPVRSLKLEQTTGAVARLPLLSQAIKCEGLRNESPEKEVEITVIPRPQQR